MRSFVTALLFSANFLPRLRAQALTSAPESIIYGWSNV